MDNALREPLALQRPSARQGDVVTVTVDGRSIEAAIFPVPGMDDRTVAIALGWGHGEAAGPIGNAPASTPIRSGPPGAT